MSRPLFANWRANHIFSISVILIVSRTETGGMAASLPNSATFSGVPGGSSQKTQLKESSGSRWRPQTWIVSGNRPLALTSRAVELICGCLSGGIACLSCI